jgi:hypothetical protein
MIFSHYTVIVYENLQRVLVYCIEQSSQTKLMINGDTNDALTSGSTSLMTTHIYSTHLFINICKNIFYCTYVKSFTDM